MMNAPEANIETQTEAGIAFRRYYAVMTHLSSQD